jgi:hypothetical protein
MSTMTTQLVPRGSREQAEAAIADLRRLGLRDDDIGLALPEPGRYLVPDTDTADTVTRMETGAAIGTPLGTIAGIGIMAALSAAAGPIGLGGLLLVGAVGGSLWGAFFGTFGGVLAKVRWNIAEDRWCEIPLGGADILVVARAGGEDEAVRRSMQHHGARCFLDQATPAATAGG